MMSCSIKHGSRQLKMGPAQVVYACTHARKHCQGCTFRPVQAGASGLQQAVGLG